MSVRFTIIDTYDISNIWYIQFCKHIKISKTLYRVLHKKNNFYQIPINNFPIQIQCYSPSRQQFGWAQNVQQTFLLCMPANIFIFENVNIGYVILPVYLSPDILLVSIRFYIGSNQYVAYLIWYVWLHVSQTCRFCSIVILHL